MQWSTLPDHIPTERAGLSVIARANKIYAIGGESASQTTAHAEVEVLTTQNHQWTSGASLNRGRHGAQAVFIGNSIYIAAGSGDRGGRPELSSV